MALCAASATRTPALSDDHDPACAADDDLRIARLALDQGDLRHAAFHVAAALNSAPQDANALALADELRRRSSDPFSLAPIKRDRNFSGTLALRARFLLATGRHGEALPLIADIIGATGNPAFLPWGCAALKALAADADVPLVAKLASRVWPIFVNREAAAADRAALAEFVALLDALAGNVDGTGDFFTHGSIVQRKAGRLMKALDWGLRAYEATPNFMSALAVANTFREQGALDHYLRWIETTASHESDGNSALLDMGDALLGKGRFAEAVAAFTRALQKVPDHPWATPSLLYAKHRLGEEDSLAWRARLIDYARDHPDNEQAARLARWVQPWTHYLPEPEDAAMGILRQLVDKKALRGKCSWRVSALEAPSCYVAVQLEARRQGQALDLQVTVEAIQSPDPRLSEAEKTFEVWSYRKFLGLKTDATLRLAPPDPAILAGIGTIAKQPYALDRWFALGREYAAGIGAARLRDVLATMAHPSLPPDELGSGTWLQRLQFAACCVVAGIDEGWPGSLRRRALLSLLRGPMDWVTGAAAIVLSEVHLTCAASRSEIKQEFETRIARVPNAYCCYRKPLATAYLRLPDAAPLLAGGLRRWLKE